MEREADRVSHGDAVIGRAGVGAHRDVRCGMYFKTHWAAATASDIAAFVIGLGVVTTAAHTLPEEWWGQGWQCAERLALVALVACGFGFGFKLIILDFGSPMTFCPTCGVHVDKRALGCWSCGDCFAPQRSHRAHARARDRAHDRARAPAPPRTQRASPHARARDLDRELDRATQIVRERAIERERKVDAEVLELDDVGGVIEIESAIEIEIEIDKDAAHDAVSECSDGVSSVFRESSRGPVRWPRVASSERH